MAFFQRVGEGASGLPRREYKFAFPGADPGAIAAVLEARARPIAFGSGPVSEVHSLYFDDERLSSCRESLAGLARRAKTRLRWYDRPFADGPLWFEVRAREGGWLRKERVPLEAAAPLREIPYGPLEEELAAALPGPAAARLLLRPRPTLLLSYRRRHFEDPSGRIRWTLDCDLVGYDQTGEKSAARASPTPVEGTVIVEAKSPTEEPESVRRLLHRLAPRLSRSSKYVACCRAMGWVGG